MSENLDQIVQGKPKNGWTATMTQRQKDQVKYLMENDKKRAYRKFL